MKEIIATEEVFNEHGVIIKVIYRYADGTKRVLNKFIPPSADEEKKLDKTSL